MSIISLSACKFSGVRTRIKETVAYGPTGMKFEQIGTIHRRIIHFLYSTKEQLQFVDENQGINYSVLVSWGTQVLL